MPLGYQARAMKRGLVKLGEPSLLAEAPCGHVPIERDVELDAGIGDTANDNFVLRYVIATIDSTFNPLVGQRLVHPTEGTFVLDRLVLDNGAIQRFIVVKAP